jgi:hypothetical protein
MDEQEFNLMQLVHITIDGVTYDMYSPLIITKGNEPIGKIEELEFGEHIEIKYVVATLLHYLHASSPEYQQTVH